MEGGEADRWRRAYERLARRMARRMDPANAARTAAADTYAAEVARIVQAIIREHRREISTDGIAAELEKRKVRTPSGGTNWTRMQVYRAMKRAGRW